MFMENLYVSRQIAFHCTNKFFKHIWNKPHWARRNGLEWQNRKQVIRWLTPIQLETRIWPLTDTRGAFRIIGLYWRARKLKGGFKDSRRKYSNSSGREWKFTTQRSLQGGQPLCRPSFNNGTTLLIQAVRTQILPLLASLCFSRVKVAGLARSCHCVSCFLVGSIKFSAFLSESPIETFLSRSGLAAQLAYVFVMKDFSHSPAFCLPWLTCSFCWFHHGSARDERPRMDPPTAIMSAWKPSYCRLSACLSLPRMSQPFARPLAAKICWLHIARARVYYLSNCQNTCTCIPRLCLSFIRLL